MRVTPMKTEPWLVVVGDNKFCQIKVLETGGHAQPHTQLTQRHKGQGENKGAERETLGKHWNMAAWSHNTIKDNSL